jgi:hypothetical protein
MTRFTQRTNGAIIAAALTVAGAFAGLVPAPALAAGNGYFRAELAAPLAEPRKEILNGIVWNCADSACTGSKGGSRAVIECERLASKVGPIVSFARGAEALDEASLAKCNKA